MNRRRGTRRRRSFHRPPAMGESAMAIRVHPTADVSSHATVGDGSCIWHWVQIRERARIGRNCNVGKDVYVDVDVTVGDDCKIQNFATLYRGVTLGNRVFVGPHASFTNDLYPRAVSGEWQAVPPNDEDGASIGGNATTLSGATIGQSGMVAARAVVSKEDTPPALSGGAPAERNAWGG